MIRNHTCSYILLLPISCSYLYLTPTYILLPHLAPTYILLPPISYSHPHLTPISYSHILLPPTSCSHPYLAPTHILLPPTSYSHILLPPTLLTPTFNYFISWPRSLAISHSRIVQPYRGFITYSILAKGGLITRSHLVILVQADHLLGYDFVAYRSFFNIFAVLDSP